MKISQEVSPVNRIVARQLVTDEVTAIYLGTGKYVVTFKAVVDSIAFADFIYLSLSNTPTATNSIRLPRHVDFTFDAFIPDGQQWYAFCAGVAGIVQVIERIVMDS